MNSNKILTLLSVFVTLSSSAVTAPKGATLDADQIFKEVEKRITAKDESAKIVMTITEANGATKTRELEVRRKAGDAPKVMVKLQSPPDLRGTALLSVGGKGKAEDQWLYLPSSKQTRRIVSSNKSSSFLDSEMSYEDMGSSSDKKFSNKILQRHPKAFADQLQFDYVNAALASFETALALDPANPQALNNVGVVRRELGRLKIWNRSA